jgi:L-cysteine S-thiosulfotransferase
MTVESLVEYCDSKTVWQGFRQGSPENTLISLYIKSLSAGMPMNVDLASRAAHGRLPAR